jgi:hypothetical protein
MSYLDTMDNLKMASLKELENMNAPSMFIKENLVRARKMGSVS